MVGIWIMDMANIWIWLVNGEEVYVLTSYEAREIVKNCPTPFLLLSYLQNDSTILPLHKKKKNPKKKLKVGENLKLRHCVKLGW